MTVPFPGHWTLGSSVRTSDIDEDVDRRAGADPMRLAARAGASSLLFPASALAHVTVAARDARGPGQTGELTFRVAERARRRRHRPARRLPPDGRARRRSRRTDGWTHDGSPRARCAGRRTSRQLDQARAAPRTSRSRSARCRTQPQIVFKALQHYADGQVVRWIQDAAADDERPAACSTSAAGSRRAPAAPTASRRRGRDRDRDRGPR